MKTSYMKAVSQVENEILGTKNCPDVREMLKKKTKAERERKDTIVYEFYFQECF